MQDSAFDLWQVDADWHGLLDAHDHLLDEFDAAILQGCLASVVKSIVVEHEYIDKDYRNVYSGFYSKRFAKQSSRATRLHFFDVAIAEEDLLTQGPDGLSIALDAKAAANGARRASGSTNGYLGNVVVRGTEYSRLGRCLLDPRKLALPFVGNPEGCLAKYSAQLMGHKLVVSAFPHQSQDTQVHTCAETALWSLFRYMTQRYRQYREMHPHDIAKLNDDLSWGRTIPSRGLSMQQVASVVGRFGMDAVMYVHDYMADLDEATDPDNWAACELLSRRDAMFRLLHTYIDSGLPPIVGVPKHAVVAVGLEYGDKPQVHRTGRVIPSSDFVQAIIVNDDNFGPYRRVLRSVRGDGESNPGYSCDEVDSLVAPLPNKVFLTPHEAERMATDIVFQLSAEHDLLGQWGNEVLVRKVVCTSSKNYKSIRDVAGDDASALLLPQPMPHFVWVAEYFPVSFWPERKAVLEVCLDATAGAYDTYPFLWVRWPNQLLINEGRIWGIGPGISDFVQIPTKTAAFSSISPNLSLFMDDTVELASGQL